MIVEYEHAGQYFRKKISFKEDSITGKIRVFFENHKELSMSDFILFPSFNFEEEFPHEFDLIRRWLRENKVSQQPPPTARDERFSNRNRKRV